MNERIKKLYKQSLEEKYQYGGSDAKPGEMYSNYITVLNPEKFAKLIVEECRTVVTEVYRKTPLELCGPLLTADEKIEEHFYGVEE